MKHTPAPWTVGTKGPALRYVIQDGGLDSLAQTFGQPKQKEDAALMAAAPDLLAALIAVVAKAMPLTVEMGSDPYNPFPKKYEPHIEQARAAIAKATGENT